VYQFVNKKGQKRKVSGCAKADDHQRNISRIGQQRHQWQRLLQLLNHPRDFPSKEARSLNITELSLQSLSLFNFLATFPVG